ncbi:Tetratricopeptide repeat-containing protein [Dyella jiangningensis]|uniref:cellulose synthase subunit BcsC-related outer membrane protein n=1 Tax=Dyella sp. AtDHG13 TaxID=1938897 RepID=UPI0008896839|nr:cellulose synthase subunit BcsC-related outer membrane protein [Dyella sp. AtDHG13]PXV60726.1 tetratricopeptide repeat protein [Dyella sp. AtDHG13]SDL00319.1 Tetratricopeptide repeat-containing protein [Dyella jiangningensis]
MSRAALSGLFAPAIVLLMAGGMVPAVVVAQAGSSAPSPQMKQLLDSARVWLAKNRPDMARGIVEKALLADPSQPDALGLMGQIELVSNRPTEAGKILEQLQQRYPDHPATLALADQYRLATRDKTALAEARLDARTGKADEAWRKMQALFPRGAPGGAYAADYYRAMASAGQRDRALNELRERVRQNPDDLGLALVLADMLTDRGNTRLEGLDIIYRIYQRPDANRPQALELWRRALNSAGADDPAYYVWYQRYLKEAPDDASAKAALAALAKKGGASYVPPPKGAAASASSPSGSSSAPSPTARQGAALGEQGLAKLREGHHDEAYALFARALKLDPDNAGKWRSLMATARFWGTLAKARAANDQGQPQQGEALARDALRQQPNQADARKVLAASLMAQSKWPEAEAILRPMVQAKPPDIDALEMLAKLLIATHRTDELTPLIAQAEQQTKGSGDALVKLRAQLLSIEADQLIAEGKSGAAVLRLEDAVILTPQDAWLRYTLARQYRGLGLPKLGRAVMQDGLRDSASPDMRYATALYLNSLDDIDAASSVLAQVSESQRTQGMRELAANLKAQRDLREAQQLLAQGRRQEAGALLDRIALDVRDDPQMLASVGREWIALGEPDKGLKRVRDWLDAHPDDPAMGVRLRYGELLASANRDDELPSWIADARARPGVTAEQQAQFDDQRLRLSLRTAGRQIDAGDLAGAERTLDAVPASGKKDKRWLLAQADLREAQRDYRGAEASAREVLVDHPGDADARLTIARMEERMGHRQAAQDIIDQVLADTPPDDVDTRLAIARRYTAIGRNTQARDVVDPLRQQYPDRSDVTLQAGRVAQSQGHYNDAAQLYRSALTQEQGEGETPSPVDGLTSAQRALQGLDDRRQGQVATAVIQSNESGSSGMSRLDATEIPVYLRIPDGYVGHYFFHADTVLLDAGTLPADRFDPAYKFGKIAALGNDGLRPVDQTDKGVALAAGYEFNGASNAWRADIGASPVGFTVSNVLGGFLYRHDFYDSSLSVDSSRRPITSSLVSYAGARDPATGESWGGVVRSGVTVRGAKDVGITTLFASLGYGVLTGENTRTNREFKVRTGIDWPVYVGTDQRFSSGLVLNYWHYANNQHFYTFGNGGYYSPGKYVSVSIPLDWTGRYRRWSWELEASLGNSWTREDEAPYFPTRADLQAQAMARMAAADLGSPYFGTGTGGGFSYTVAAALEYRLTSHWVIGTRFKLDRSRDYAPNLGTIYLRYFFDQQRLPVPFPPNPVKPYSAY